MDHLLTPILFTLHFISSSQYVLTEINRSFKGCGYYQDLDRKDDSDMIYRMMRSISRFIWIILTICFIAPELFVWFNSAYFFLSVLLYIK